MDQNNPIHAGWVTNPRTGAREPDLYFRGFYVWNGECGDVSIGITTFLYRYVCCNRMIWGQKAFQSVRMIHSKFARDRFVSQLVPALRAFTSGTSDGIASGLEQARRRQIAKDNDGVMNYLSKLGFGLKEADKIAARHIDEEGRPIMSVFDVVNAITSVARDITYQDDRVQMERVASRLMPAI